MGDELSKRAKFVLITWSGANVGGIKRAKMSTDKSLVKNVIRVSLTGQKPSQNFYQGKCNRTKSSQKHHQGKSDRTKSSPKRHQGKFDRTKSSPKRHQSKCCRANSSKKCHQGTCSRIKV